MPWPSLKMLALQDSCVSLPSVIRFSWAPWHGVPKGSLGGKVRAIASRSLEALAGSKAKHLGLQRNAVVMPLVIEQDPQQALLPSRGCCEKAACVPHYYMIASLLKTVFETLQ